MECVPKCNLNYCDQDTGVCNVPPPKTGVICPLDDCQDHASSGHEVVKQRPCKLLLIMFPSVEPSCMPDGQMRCQSQSAKIHALLMDFPISMINMTVAFCKKWSQRANIGYSGFLSSTERSEVRVACCSAASSLLQWLQLVALSPSQVENELVNPAAMCLMHHHKSCKHKSSSNIKQGCVHKTSWCYGRYTSVGSIEHCLWQFHPGGADWLCGLPVPPARRDAPGDQRYHGPVHATGKPVWG